MAEFEPKKTSGFGYMCFFANSFKYLMSPHKVCSIKKHMKINPSIRLVNKVLHLIIIMYNMCRYGTHSDRQLIQHSVQKMGYRLNATGKLTVSHYL